MATRHQVRQSVISMLYAHEMGDDSQEFKDEFLNEKKIRNEQRNFTFSLYNGVLENLANIDEILNNHLEKWKLDEIGIVERAVLRLGVYELIFTDTDVGVVISEAVALGDEFVNDSSKRLINGILDNIAKSKK